MTVAAMHCAAAGFSRPRQTGPSPWREIVTFAPIFISAKWEHRARLERAPFDWRSGRFHPLPLCQFSQSRKAKPRCRGYPAICACFFWGMRERGFLTFTQVALCAAKPLQVFAMLRNGAHGGFPLRGRPKYPEVLRKWSEWQDLNLRPPRPERGALPGCATLRDQRRRSIAPDTCSRKCAISIL
jgi:hypothetical protein